MLKTTFVASMMTGYAAALGDLEGKTVVDYSQNGVNWKGECATGTEQSPINIKTKGKHADYVAAPTNDAGSGITGYKSTPLLRCYSHLFEFIFLPLA